MRAKKIGNGLVLHAVAGTHVVYLGWDVTDPALRRGLLGFAIQRTDHTEGETYWLRGTKTFEATSAALPIGSDASSHEQPYQTFQWGDYTVKEAHDYTYRLVPVYGKPDALVDGKAVTVRVKSESAWGRSHSVFFNRGAIASQEYARRFGNRKPADAGAAAYDWLSRGLVEAIVAFIGRATDAAYGLRGAFYEFEWVPILEALRAAHRRGADVEILYDAIENKDRDPVGPNEQAIEDAGIKSLCRGFTDGKLMHNKFLVLTRNGKPVAVWTGSTNLTENGLFGHLNCGHAVEADAIAARYLDYWTLLKSDPGTPAIRLWTGVETPPPPLPPARGTTTVFSPQKGAATLDRYGEIADAATRGLFMTFAFGMNKVFQKVYEQRDDVLRFALMEKEGNGAGIAQGRIDITRIRKLPNVLVAIGKRIAVNSFDRWLAEIDSAVDKANVHYVHTKFMLVDPLGPDPVVVAGSANFSEASTTTNEENMLVIRGDRRVADIYLGEFMRSFAHYAFREAVWNRAQSGADASTWTPQFLVPDDGWTKNYFAAGSSQARRRLYFSGQ